MGFIELLVLSLAVAANNLVVPAGIETMGQAHLWKRVVLVFGVFEFCIPLGGMSVGQWLANKIASTAEIFSASIIIGVGILFLVNAFRTQKDVKIIAEQITR